MLRSGGMGAGLRRVGVVMALLAGSMALAVPARAEMVLRIGNGADPETLDPHRITASTDVTLVRDICEGLVAYNARAEVVPGLAESWTVSEDGRTYTFTLRPNLKWGDGTPLTADDIVWSFQRSVSPKTRPGFPELLYSIENAERIVRGELPPESMGVTSPDPRTVVIRLNRPFPDFLDFAAVSRHGYPVQRTAIEKHGDDFVKPGNYFCSGPFNLAESVPQSHIKLVRNPHYWDAANVKPDAVYYLPIENSGTELKAFRAGELHATSTVPLPQLDWLRANMPESLRIEPYAGTYFYLPNLTREPWKSNRNLRWALALAVDRQALVERVLKGGQQPAYTLVPPDLPNYPQPKPEWATWTQAQREAEARRLLAAEGFGPGGKPLKLEIFFNTLESHRQIAIAVAAMWKQTLGVDVTLNNTEWKVLLERQARKDWPDLIRRGWIARFPFSHLDLLRSTASPQAGFGFDNPEFDRLMAEADTIADPVAYRRKLAEAEALAMAEMPLIPLYHYSNLRMVSPKLRGWEENNIDVRPAKYLWLEK